MGWADDCKSDARMLNVHKSVESSGEKVAPASSDLGLWSRLSAISIIVPSHLFASKVLTRDRH